MQRDEIIEMARDLAEKFGTRMCDENGDTHGEELYAMGVDDVIDIIKLVATKEREECAKLVETLPPVGVYRQLERATFKDAAIAIRDRGNQ